MRISRGFLTISILLLVVLAGCQEKKTFVFEAQGTYQEQSFDPKAEISTKQFSSSEDLEQFFKGFEGRGYYGGPVFRAMGAEVMEMAVDDSAGAPMVKSQAADGIDYSDTNVQVQGIDEADIIKTDGEYIYTVSGKTLFIIKAYPGKEAEIVSKLEFDSDPNSIFIKDNKLVVFGNFYDNDYFSEIGIRPREGMTFVDIYDVTDKKKPAMTKHYKFEGGYFNGRMKGDYVYLITRTMPIYNRPVPLPIIMEDDVRTSLPIEKIYYYDVPYRNPQFVTVHALNVDTDALTDSKSVVVEGSQNMYMSHENIYLTYTEWINEYELLQEIMRGIVEPKLSANDRELIAKIKGTDNDVLSQYEKEQKINQIYQEVLTFLPDEEREILEDQGEDKLEEKLKELEYLEFTVVNKLEVEDGKIEVEENGKVPGRIVNQFSMDEFDEVFRIATTISQRWSRFTKESEESVNNVYALDDDLNIIGRLEGLAKDETIFSTRFIGDKLYMVTFRQIDPFFVIDLSDPKKIKSLGELKIPGFSRYLHPYDENTIIGIGQDATKRGRAEGLKISLFDVTDVTKPKEIVNFITDEKNAQSTALWEHKAFLFDKNKELLVIPAYSYDYRNREEEYNGAFVFKISKDSIELRGLVDHSKGADKYYGALVERSLYIEELLYTKSRGLLRINELKDLSSVRDIELKGSAGDIPIY